MTTPPVVSITDELIAELEAAANACESWYVEQDLGITLDLVSDKDNRFVLAASPATILALLAERAALKQQLAAASPAAESYELFRQEAKRWRDIVQSVVDEIPHRSAVRGNAPGHGHDVPGIWDSDNGPLAGKECAWCKTWHSALDAARNIGSGD